MTEARAILAPPHSSAWIRLCYAYVVGLLSVYAILSWIEPPTMFSDSGMGFRVWDQMRAGGAWNELRSPDPADIAQSRGEFMAAWSPSQYLVPGAIEACGVNLGHAMLLTALGATIIGLMGWARLFQQLELSPQITALTIAVLASSRGTALPFGIYNGGEVLVFGAAPWLLAFVWRRDPLRLLDITLLSAAMFAAFCVKHSFAIPMIGAFVGLGGRAWSRQPTIARALGVGGGLLAALVVSIGAYRWLYLSRGYVATDYHWELNAPLRSALFAWAAPALESLGGISVMERVFRHDPSPIIPFDYMQSVAALGLLALLATGLGCLVLRGSSTSYRWLVGGVWLAVSGAYAILMMTGAPVWPHEGRHYRVPGILILPGLLQGVAAFRWRGLRWLGGAVVILACVYGVASFYARWSANRAHDAGARGFTHGHVDRAALDLLRELNAAPNADEALVFVTSAEIALEASRTRVLAVGVDFVPLEQLQQQEYHGRAKRLFAIIPRRFESLGKLRAVLTSFVDYDRWTLIDLPQHVVCIPADTTPIPDSIATYPRRSFESSRP